VQGLRNIEEAFHIHLLVRDNDGEGVANTGNVQNEITIAKVQWV